MYKGSTEMQQLLSPQTNSDSQRDHRAAPKDRLHQQQPPCEHSANMACHNLNIENPHFHHHPACEGTSSLDLVSELAALRAAIREQNCLMSNNLQRVLDEQRDANKIILSSTQRLQRDVAQLILAQKSSSHIPFSDFTQGENNISTCGFTQRDAIPQNYLVATPPPPPLGDCLFPPYPITTPPLHTMASLKVKLEHGAGLSPPTSPHPDNDTIPHTPYAFTARHEDDFMSVEQVLTPTVHSWSPKLIAPPKPRSDSDEEEEPSTTDVESPENRTAVLSKLLSILEHKTTTSGDGEESTNSSSGTRTPPIVPTSRFTPYFFEHPRCQVPTSAEWVARCNIYGEEQKVDDRDYDDAHSAPGALDEERVEMPAVFRISTPVSPPTYFHLSSPVRGGHSATGSVIDNHYDIDPAWAHSSPSPVEEEDIKPPPVASVAPSPSARTRTASVSACSLSASPFVRHNGDGGRSASISGLMSDGEVLRPTTIEGWRPRSHTPHPFYPAHNPGAHPIDNDYGAPSPEQIFTRSPPPSLPQSRSSSPMPDGRLLWKLMFQSSATLQPPPTPPYLYAKQQPPSRSNSVQSCNPHGCPRSEVSDKPELPPSVVDTYSRPPSITATVPPPLSPPPRIYGTPIGSSTSSTSTSPSLQYGDMKTPPRTPLDMASPLRSRNVSPGIPRGPAHSPAPACWVPTYGGVPLDSFPSPITSVQQRSPARTSGSPVITPALTPAYAPSPAGSAAITYSSPRPMISPTNSLGLQDDTEFPEHTLTLSQAGDSALRMQRLENLVEMLQTKVLGLTDELSTIKGSPTTPRMPPTVVLPPQPPYSDISSPPQPTLFYTSPAGAGSIASSPATKSQPQLRSYLSRHSSPRSNKATVSMITTPLTSAPSSRMPYPKSPDMRRSPVLSVVLPLVKDVPEVKVSPQRRQQRAATTIPPPEVTYGGGMSFDDAYSLARGSSDDEDAIAPAPTPAPVPMFPSPLASPPPAPVTLNLEQHGRTREAIPRSPRLVHVISPIPPRTRSPKGKGPLHPDKMGRPSRAHTRQRTAEANNPSGSNGTEKPPAVVVPPPYYPQDGKEVLVIPEELPTLPSIRPSTQNRLPPFPAFDTLSTSQDRQSIFPPLTPPSPASRSSLHYYSRPSERPDSSYWPPYYSGVVPRSVFSQPPVRSQSSYPALTPVYEAPPPPPPFVPPPVSLGTTSQAPYQRHYSWTPRTRGTVRLHSGATPPISIQTPAPPAPPPPMTGYPVPNGATGTHPTTRAYVPHFPPYKVPTTVTPSYAYGSRTRRNLARV